MGNTIDISNFKIKYEEHLFLQLIQYFNSYKTIQGRGSISKALSFQDT